MMKVFATIIEVWKARRELARARKDAARDTTTALVAVVDALNGAQVAS